MSKTLEQVVTFTLKDPKYLQKFKAAAAEMEKSTKKNPGCISCKFCLEIGEGGKYVIIETWPDLATCDADNAGPHVVKFLTEMGDAVSLDIKKYLVC